MTPIESVSRRLPVASTPIGIFRQDGMRLVFHVSSPYSLGSRRRRTAQLKVSVSLFHRVDRGCCNNLSEAVICQVSGVPVSGNHGGKLINRYSLKRWTCGSYILRNSCSFCSAVP